MLMEYAGGKDVQASFHDAGAPTLDNLGQSFAPCRLDMHP